MKRAIVLLSGGIDSAVTLYIAKEKGFNPLALIFDYGQRQKKEIAFAKRIADKAKCRHRVIKLDFPHKGSSLLDRKKRVPINRPLGRKGIPSTYVPARNLIFLSIATSSAEIRGAKAIFIGAHTEDYSGYPDCRKAFLERFKKTINAGTKNGRNITIYAPLINKNKKDIIKTGLSLKVPLELTWSCYMGGKRPCGVCDSCRFRARGFEELGIKDPALRK